MPQKLAFKFQFLQSFYFQIVLVLLMSLLLFIRYLFNLYQRMHDATKNVFLIAQWNTTNRFYHFYSFSGRIFDIYRRTVHEKDVFVGFLKFHLNFSCFPKFHHVIWFNGTAIVFTFSVPTFCSSVRFSYTAFHPFIFRFSTVRRLKTSFLMNNPLLWTLFFRRQLKH